MTPRFVAVCTAFFLAAIAYLRPEQMAEVIGKFYALITKAPPPASINQVVYYMPYVLGGLAALVVAHDFSKMLGESYRDFSKARKAKRLGITPTTQVDHREYHKYLDYHSQRRTGRSL